MLSLKLTKGQIEVLKRVNFLTLGNIINDMNFYYSLHANDIQRYVSKSFNNKNKMRKIFCILWKT
jgi:hypothetical protein